MFIRQECLSGIALSDGGAYKRAKFAHATNKIIKCGIQVYVTMTPSKSTSESRNNDPPMTNQEMPIKEQHLTFLALTF